MVQVVRDGESFRNKPSLRFYARNFSHWTFRQVIVLLIREYLDLFVLDALFQKTGLNQISVIAAGHTVDSNHALRVLCFDSWLQSAWLRLMRVNLLSVPGCSASWLEFEVDVGNCLVDLRKLQLEVIQEFTQTFTL